MAEAGNDRSPALSPARRVAVQALFRVTEQGAWASRALDAEIRKASLHARDARLASEMARDMYKRGIYVVGFSYPVVPKEQARIRVQLSAAHERDQIDKAINAFIEVGKKHGVIK